MHQIGPPAVHALDGDLRADPSQSCKALSIVAVVVAAAILIGSAVALIEVRRLQQQKLQPLSLAGQQARRPAKQILALPHWPPLSHLRRQGWIGRQQDAAAQSQRCKSLGHRADDIGKAAGLDEGRALGGQVEQLHGG